jgi:hypothetical protein
MFTLKHRFFEPSRALLSSLFSPTFLLVFMVFIVSFAPTNVAHALDLSFAWDVNTEPDLAGYRLFYREEGQNYDYDNRTWEGIETTCTIYGLDDNTTYYFVVRAYNVYGDESENSNEVCCEPENIEHTGEDSVLDNLDAYSDDPNESVNLGAEASGNGGGGGGGCFIATSANNSAMATSALSVLVSLSTIIGIASTFRTMRFRRFWGLRLIQGIFY